LPLRSSATSTRPNGIDYARTTNNGGQQTRDKMMIAAIGAHQGGAEVKVMERGGGSYVTDGATETAVPKAKDPKELTLAGAVLRLSSCLLIVIGS
jgi:topoisomerase IA-like protein